MLSRKKKFNFRKKGSCGNISYLRGAEFETGYSCERSVSLLFLKLRFCDSVPDLDFLVSETISRGLTTSVSKSGYVNLSVNI